MLDKLMKRRSNVINTPSSIENQQQIPKTEAKSHQNSISKGSNPKERIELMMVSTDERLEIPSTEVMDQSPQEPTESKSAIKNETTNSLNLTPQTTNLEVSNETTTSPRERSYSKAHQMKSAVLFFFFLQFFILSFFFLKKKIKIKIKMK